MDYTGTTFCSSNDEGVKYLRKMENIYEVDGYFMSISKKSRHVTFAEDIRPEYGITYKK